MPEEQAKAHILRVYGSAGEDVVAASKIFEKLLEKVHKLEKL